MLVPFKECMHRLKCPHVLYILIMIPMISLVIFNKFLLLQGFTTQILYRSNYTSSSSENTTSQGSIRADYIIYTPKCRIENLDAFNADAKKYYVRERYYVCSKTKLLSQISLADNDTAATLQINKKLVPKYSKDGVACCYSNITRGDSKGAHLDNKITRSKCQSFNSSTAISIEVPLEVKCQNKRTKKEVYKNVHLPIAKTEAIQTKIKSFTSNARPLSILIIGIDSISRLNMIRSMPKTRKYLKSHSNWLEFKVYHKIDDNTFPNLIAMLTGMTPSMAWHQCNPRQTAGIDKCNFIWRPFALHNYVTAYIEDSAKMSTFNYLKEGFQTPPTDFYGRAYQLACQDLKSKNIDDAIYCTGPEMEAERIARLCQNFVRVFNSTPYFGFFWMNSFSHQQLNTPSRMDQKMAQFIEDITKEAGENSVILFLSDHGIRFGNIRHTLTGYLEERLPYFFISVPKWFRKQFPDVANNLADNREKLITPYDVYMTLQDIMVHSGLNETVNKSLGCPNCTSIFSRIDMNRSCQDASIPDRWCTCYDFRNIGLQSNTSMLASKLMIDNLHAQIAEKNATQKCAKYSLSKIVRVFGSQGSADFYDNNRKFIVIIETKPKATFEATFVSNGELGLHMHSGFSRLDSYFSTSRCVNDSNLRLLCYCKK